MYKHGVEKSVYTVSIIKPLLEMMGKVLQNGCHIIYVAVVGKKFFFVYGKCLWIYIIIIAKNKWIWCWAEIYFQIPLDII